MNVLLHPAIAAKTNNARPLSRMFHLLDIQMVAGTFIGLLSLFREDRLDLGRKPRMRHRIHRAVLHLGARRIFSKKVVTVPVPRRSNRSRDKPAAAIWTDISQNAFDARIAEGALVRAYARLKRIGRQRLVAVLTGRSEFKHGVLNVELPIMCNQ